MTAVESQRAIQRLFGRVSRWLGASMSAAPNVAEDSLDSLLRGEAGAVDRLFEVLYADLRQRADALIGGERNGGSLAPTELVHEAWLKFVRHEHLQLNGRTHFLAVAALAMKQVLVDRARARATRKRDGGPRVELDSDVPGGTPIAFDLLDFASALSALDARFPAQAAIASMHLSGMTLREIAEHVGKSFDHVRDQWRFARAFLHKQLAEVPE